jgi:hypothetical protein
VPFVRALPNQYLLVGRGGNLVNRGSAVQAFLWPGTVHVLVPSTKQEAGFEFSQETKDGTEQELRREILPLEQDPQIVEAASGVFRGATVSLYDADRGLVRQAVPLIDAAAHAVERALSRAGLAEERADAAQ